MKRDDWWQAVWEAIFRVYDRNGTPCFTRKELFNTEPLKRMVSTSRSKGQHPEMSVSYILTDFTRWGKYAQIKKTGHGKYELTDLGMYVVSTFKDHFRPREHGATFDITTSRDFLHRMVIPQHQEFKKNHRSSRHALLAIICAYHMYEWVNEKTFTPEHFKSVYSSEADRDYMAELFNLARIIVNGTKHFKPAKQRVKTKVQGGFPSDFGDRSRPLNVKLSGSENPDDWEPIDNILDRMVEFWRRQESVGAF